MVDINRQCDATRQSWNWTVAVNGLGTKRDAVLSHYITYITSSLIGLTSSVEVSRKFKQTWPCRASIERDNFPFSQMTAQTNRAVFDDDSLVSHED